MGKLFGLLTIGFIFSIGTIFLEGIFLHYAWNGLAVPTFTLPTLVYAQCFVIVAGISIFRFLAVSKQKDDEEIKSAMEGIRKVSSIAVTKWIEIGFYTVLVFLVKLFFI